MKGFGLGLVLKQRRKATRKSPIGQLANLFSSISLCAKYYCHEWTRETVLRESMNDLKLKRSLYHEILTKKRLNDLLSPTSH